MGRRIGIPRTLYFYSFFPLWKTFFEELGLEVVFSPPTNKAIIDLGVRDTVNDACIPIKVFHGHVAALRNKVDCIFIPRLTSIKGSMTLCPKFLGLPDMVKSSVENLPALIVENLQLNRRSFPLPRFFFRVGKRFTGNVWRIWRAYFKALHDWKAYKRQLLQGYYPQARGSRDVIMAPPREKRAGSLRLAVLAYPYVLYDPYLSIDLLKKLEGLEVDAFIPDSMQPGQLQRGRRHLPLDLFWYYSNQVTWTSLYFLYEEPQQVDGIIHITAFGCGPDAMVDKLIELEARKNKMPFITITIDEHTGEAGMSTRLEAFVDMLKQRKDGTVS
jgi:predicted nucleotide-binding protein (sugar kinase/HSP70/actin superfamily)